MLKMFIVAKYTLVEAYKRRLILLFGLTLITSLAVGGYAAGLAVVYKQNTFAAFYAFCMRIGTALILSGYVILNESRALESDRVFISLGLPIRRARYLAEKWAAYSLIALCMALPAGLFLLITPLSATTMSAWTVTFYCELMIVVSAALMLSMIFTQPLLSLSIFGAFYLFARGSGEFARHSAHILAANAGGPDAWMAWVVKAAAWVVPSLERFAPTALLLYDAPHDIDWVPVLLQTFLYTALLFTVSIDYLQRKRF